MRPRTLSGILACLALGTAASAFGCQLLYDKNDLTIATGGAAGMTTTTSSGGGGTGGTTTSTGGGGATTTSSGGGGSTSSTGGGGSTTSSGGGGTTTSTGGGGTGGTGGSTGGTGGDMDGGPNDGGDCTTDRLFVLGTSTTGIVCGTYAPMTGWSVSTNANGNSSDRPAAQLVSATKGIGLFFQGPAPGPMRAVTLANDVCGAPADVPSASTEAAPGAALLDGKVQALFHGAVGAGQNHPYFTAWDPANGTWTAPAQVSMDVFSDAPASLASNGTSMIAVYGGGDSNLYRVAYAGGAWSLPAKCFFADPATMMTCEQTDKAVTPAVVALDTGKWLVVYKEKAPSTALRWLTHDGVTNSVPAQIAMALSSTPVALARVTGGAVLAFRGTDNGVYATVFDAATSTWAPIAHVANPATTSASPAVSAGVCDHTAELVFVDASDSGKLKHSTFDAVTWSAPVLVGGTQMKGVALAGSK